MLVVNPFGGPGSGKTALAMMIAGALKVSCPDLVTEFVSEATKEFVWERRSAAMRNRILTLGEQSFRLSRLEGEVDVAVTDSPVLLNLVYARREGWPRCYLDLCLYAHAMHRSLDVLVRRPGSAWEQAGRRETEAAALAIDRELAELLAACGIACDQARPHHLDAARIAEAAAGIALRSRPEAGADKDSR